MVYFFKLRLSETIGWVVGLNAFIWVYMLWQRRLVNIQEQKHFNISSKGLQGLDDLDLDNIEKTLIRKDGKTTRKWFLIENTILVLNDAYLHPGGNFITE